ncbi:MAG: hypothetical protein HF967_01305, partial [Methanosarcinales archaeon]|nr:hypothetical protein [Methanosarcinales archaeon]
MQDKKFEELVKKRISWVDASKENGFDFNSILAGLYSDPTHFIYELLQNAEDEGAKEVRFELFENKLCIYHNGKNFDVADIYGVTGIGKSTKNLTSIGKFGIGFKSVFAITETPYIFSGDYHIKIENWVIPSLVDNIQIDGTLIKLPFNHKKRSNEDVFMSVSKKLENVGLKTILFLKNVNIIKWKNPSNKGYYSKESNLLSSNLKKVILSSSEVSEEYIVIEKTIDIENKNLEIKIAYKLGKNKSGKDIIVKDTDSKLFVYFQTERVTHLNFIIQGPFKTTPNRENIPLEDEQNKSILEKIADLVAESLTIIKNLDYLDVDFLNLLPINSEYKQNEQIYSTIYDNVKEKFSTEELLPTLNNKYAKANDVLLARVKGLTELLDSGDIKKLFSKQYWLNTDITSDRTPELRKYVIDELGIKEVSFKIFLEHITFEFIQEKSDEWLIKFYKQLSNQRSLWSGNASHITLLKDIPLIRLENGKSISINDYKVFFSLEKKETYGFEHELNVIKKDIIDAIYECEKEEKDGISEFLEKLGVKGADPYEIIEEHILPVYEGEEWKEKDSNVLLGYIRYIKDNLNKYVGKAPKEEPLNRLKKLRIRIEKDTDGSEWYSNPENIYLSKIYDNKYDLEKLFDGIDVNFVHPCYSKYASKELDKEKNELKKKLNGRSIKWKKKNRKDIKKNEEKIKKLVDEKNKKVNEWKEFFLKIGGWETIIVKKDPSTKVYEGSDYANNEVTKKKISYENKKESTWGGEEWKETDSREYYIEDDWISPHLESLLNKLNKESYKNIMAISKQLLKLLDDYWNIYKDKIQTKYYYRYYSQQGWSRLDTKSTFYLMLLNNAWLPTTKNTLAKPSEVFLDNPEIRKVLGDTVPYLAIKIENENFIEALGINTQADIKGVLNYLKALIEQKSEDKEKFEKLYEFLDNNFEEDDIKIKEAFKQNDLIFVPDTEKKYYGIEEAIWINVSNIFGENRAYLEKNYLNFKNFFMKKLGINEKPILKDYVNVLKDISKKSEISDENIIVRIYERMNDILKDEEYSQDDFIEELKFWTDGNEFRKNDNNVFVNDDDVLYDLFKDEPQIAFLKIPPNHYPKLEYFIKKTGILYLTESVETKLVNKMEKNEPDDFTNKIQRSFPYILRYLYQSEYNIYDKLKKDKTLIQLKNLKCYGIENIQVEYTLNSCTVSSKQNAIIHKWDLYIQNDCVKNIDDYLAKELSKLFGGIKGFDDFLCALFIKNIDEEINEFLRIKGIGELPEDEEKWFERSNYNGENDGIKEPSQNIIEITKSPPEYIHTNVPEKEPSNEIELNSNGEDFVDTPPSISDLPNNKPPNENTKNILKNKEVPWTPEVPPEHVPINIKEYNIKEQKKIRDKIESNPTGRNFIVESLNSNPLNNKNSNEEDKKNIGRWGEEYAIIYIKSELEKIHPNIPLIDTKEGFKLKKDDDTIAEVIW